MRAHAMVAAAAIAASLTLVAGCGSDSSDNNASGDEKVTLTVATFNEFGYDDLLDEYMKQNPNVTSSSRRRQRPPTRRVRTT